MSTYIPIVTQTLTSTASSVTFSYLPQNYTDLILVIQTAISSGANDTWLQFNSDGGTNYSRTKVAGNGTNATSFRASNSDAYYGVGNIGTGWMTSVNHVLNYSNTTTYKTLLTRHGSLDNETAASIGLWRNTSAINSIKIAPGTSTFISGSTFSLYGIASGAPKASGGDIVTTDGTYWYHAFKSSGLFTPVQDISANVLIVGGGGGGGRSGSGSQIGSGGGAGGLRNTTLNFSKNYNYSIAIGAGSTGGQSGNSDSIPGSPTSVIGTNITTFLTYGGGGGVHWNTSGQDGGSGSGGGNGYAGGVGNFGGFSPAEGNNGASNNGGGGGAGASASGANGGAGVNTYSSWATATGTGASGYYAGGGGAGNGGTGGAGGGGNGNTGGGSGSNGIVNTGGGAGGNYNNGGAGGNGGSGIVIVRYAI